MINFIETNPFVTIYSIRSTKKRNV